jgi:hypothetical protein
MSYFIVGEVETIRVKKLNTVEGRISTIEAMTPLNVKAFGAKGDGVTNDAAAIQAAINYSYSKRRPNTTESYGAGCGPSIYFPIPSASYYCGGTPLVISHTLGLYGPGSGQPEGDGSLLKWNGTSNGIRVLSSGPGFLIQGLDFDGGFTGTEGEFHAISPDAVGTVTRCQFYNWPGDAVNEDENLHAGATNGSVIDRIYTENCRCAHKAFGGDANAGEKRGIETKGNRQAGVLQLGFLGDHYYSCSINGSARSAWNTGAAGHPVSYVHQGGHYYAAAYGQETWCSANAPTGTTASNQGWVYWMDGAASPSTGVPTWFNGIAVRAGGAYVQSGLNNYSTFTGCYAEDNNPSQFDRGAELYSPFMSSRWLVSGGVFYGEMDAMSGGKTRKVHAATPATFPVELGQTVFQCSDATSVIDLWNTQPLSGSTPQKIRFQLGLEADGVTRANLASIYTKSTTNNPATAEANIFFATRLFGSAGTLTDRAVLDGPNLSFRAAADNNMDLGLTGTQWKRLYLSTGVYVGGNQVVGARQSAVTSPTGGATVDSQARTAIDAIRTVLSAHGLTA